MHHCCCVVAASCLAGNTLHSTKVPLDSEDPDSAALCPLTNSKKNTPKLHTSLLYENLLNSFTSGARNMSLATVRPDGPPTLTLPSKFRMPASATLAMKFSSTRTLAVLECLCTREGLMAWRWARPANQSMLSILRRITFGCAKSY